jgi:uncharacterized DUF497 family protein
LNYNFEWDPKKAQENWRKHKVKFEHSATVMMDPNALTIYDKSHSTKEDRWITLGLASTGVLLVVNHTYTEIDNINVTIRIISSRKATKNEKEQYTEG